MPNKCCMRPGYAKVVSSSNPNVLWRVVCTFCGLVMHEQKENIPKTKKRDTESQKATSSWALNRSDGGDSE